MEFEYSFIATINKPHAFQDYLLSNITWGDAYIRNEPNILENNVSLYTNRELTPPELEATTSVIDLYVDPLFFLIFEHAENTTMITEFTSSAELTINGKKVLQTFIFSAPSNSEDIVLDSFKTIIEYNCTNTLLFELISNSFIVLEIYDLTRDVQIFETNIPLDEIETKWKGMILPPENDTVFRSSFIGGLQYQTPNHDCVWQIRVSLSHPTAFRVRLNSLQQLFYKVE